MKVSPKTLALAFGFFLLFASTAAAQQPATGALRGQLADEFGGVIVGATVTVTNAAGKARSVVTDSDGGFQIAGLQPGRYSVRIFSTGFTLFENTEVDIAAGRNELPKVTLADLKPGTMIVVSSTVGADPTRITAIQLVSNIGPIVAMMTRRPGAGGAGAGGLGALGGGGGFNFGFGIGQP